MNTITILQKCIAELGKKKPKKDYVIGMLETLVATSGGVPMFAGQPMTTPPIVPAFIPDGERGPQDPPIIRGFGDLVTKVPEQTDAEKDAESAYLRGGIGKI